MTASKRRVRGPNVDKMSKFEIKKPLDICTTTPKALTEVNASASSHSSFALSDFTPHRKSLTDIKRMIRTQSVTPNSGTLPIDAAGDKHNDDNQMPKFKMQSGSSTLTGQDTGMYMKKNNDISGTIGVNNTKQSLRYTLPTVTIPHKKNNSANTSQSVENIKNFEHGRLNQNSDSRKTSKSGFFKDTKLKRKGKEILQEPPEHKNLMAEFDQAYEYRTVMDVEEEKDAEHSDFENYHDNDDFEEVSCHPNLWEGYMDFGPPTKVCSKCGATMWDRERNNKSYKRQDPTFSLCCRNGQVHLEKEPLPPEPLASLLSGGDKSKHFKQNIRVYNCIFQFTSTGGRIDNRINRGSAPYCFRLQGQNYHLLGSLVPLDGSGPKFCQLYIYDTQNEVENRINALGGASDHVDPDIVEELLAMLDKNNKLVKAFRMARNRFENQELDEFKLVLISSQSASGRPNHITSSDEVAAFIVSDDTDTGGFRDTVVHSKQEGLKRIHETDPHFMQFQYPLLFPMGNEGYHVHIPLRNTKKTEAENVDDEDLDPDSKQRRNVSLREYYCYKIMIRTSEGLTLHLAGRLWQQFIVDAFAAIEQYRLDWVSSHQTTIRDDLYHSVRDALRKGDNDPMHVGKAVILPASFTGSQRYMSQYFKDSLAICRAIGHPSLFLTMTCNSKWPEIQQMIKLLPNVDPVDAPDIVSRVFKLKLDQLLDLIKKERYFGRCIGVMHVIEFQKRGLPHVHMLIWLHPQDRPNTIEKIDDLVSAEIPDQNKDPICYEAVKNYMIHGPCGKDCVTSSCMVKGKCMRHFPKRFNGHTFFDDSGFPVYRRRKTGRFIRRKGVNLDNQYVVPYNRDLLVRFQCHINVEICNSSRSLKYVVQDMPVPYQD